MARRRAPDPKAEALRQRGTLNPHPERVSDDAFARCSEFLDSRDLLQVKYEMLRRVRLEGESIRRAVEDFGFSRPTYYEAQAAFERGGLAGLLRQKPGPRRAHKLREEVVDMLEQACTEAPSLRALDLVCQVEQRFGLSVHPRSIERALKQREKKRRRSPHEPR
jgi:transposase